MRTFRLALPVERYEGLERRKLGHEIPYVSIRRDTLSTLLKPDV
jgi:hypothetical protein